VTTAARTSAARNARTMAATDLDHLAINVVRGLAMDAPQAAGNGHPGTAMALAPLAHVLFSRIMRHDPARPDWPDRDRFVLSCGHASILLYSMLYLCGYGLSLDDIHAFRQWGSLTPGHPESRHTRGVEVTTGPLGQGAANSVGMALAERLLRSRFGAEVCDHRTFVLVSDGDLMEGVSHEAASLAGHLGLGRLVWVYDDNHITIDGPTELALSDDAAARFAAYGWHVQELGEAANDLGVLETALRAAMSVDDCPSFIRLRTHIGWPAPHLTDSKHAHGTPLGPDEVRATKEILGLPPDEEFWVPDELLGWYRAETAARGREAREQWEERRRRWAAGASAATRAGWEACLAGRGLPGWESALPSFEVGQKVATRKASGACLNALAPLVPALVAGGADLTDNTGTKLEGLGVQSRTCPSGRLVHFGVREHAMGGVMTGAAMHGGVLPVGGTFFVFSDYMRAAVRLAALSRAKVIYSFTHDSVGLGPDGPTHQPVEQLAAMRAMPGLLVIRPADANETAAAWRVAVAADGPVALVLTRQDVPVLAGTSAEGVARGAYVLGQPDGGAGGRPGDGAGGQPDIILIGTGSEVGVCVAAAELLARDGVAARVVSMPSWELFEAAGREYQASVLPAPVPRLAVEAAASFGWARFADDVVAIDRFGASAPGERVLAELGYTPENVATRARELLEQRREAEIL